MQSVEALLSQYWIFGWFVYYYGYSFVSSYTYMFSFVMALFFQDWMMAETEVNKVIYDFFTPFY